jgi:hypothetical protein
MLKLSCAIILSLFCCIHVYGQTALEPVSIPSPNAASLGVYGQVPVSHFTGTPNISIPIYEVREGSIKLPISLSYHPASVKPAMHAGWVGLGWTLIAGGAITRNQRGMPDEKCTYNGDNIGFYYHYSKLGLSNWNSSDALKAMSEHKFQSFVNGSLPKYEVEQDEFNFNFLGYSGKFFLDHTGQWKVISEDNIKVEFNNSTDFIYSHTQSFRYPSDVLNNYKAHFHKFTLITSDGTRYEFGGNDAAVEYSVPYRKQHIEDLVANTWNLTKITSTDGQSIRLNYKEDRKPICSFGPLAYSATYTNTENCPYYAAGPSKHLPGNLIFPSYLSSIETSHGIVAFNSTVTNELRYSDNDLFILNRDEKPYFDQYSDIQWFKLDKIEIKDKTNALKKEFLFSYINNPESRLKLSSLTERSRSGSISSPYIHLQPYQFFYNIKPLPLYSSQQVDHWGFYNGRNPDYSQNYHLSRSSDPNGTHQRAEILERITYPTGGYTTFDFEPNTCSSVVDKNRNTLSAYVSTVGGLRLRRTSSFSVEGKVELIKEYYYVKGFAPGKNPATLPSSGILGGHSQYSWHGYKGNSYSMKLPFTYDTFSSASMLPFGYNSQGSHIGYSEIVEISTTAATVAESSPSNANGYTIYTFTNFDNDIWEESHMDEGYKATGTTVWTIDLETSVYSPFTSKALERGKLTSQVSYDQAGNKVKESTFKYEKSSDDYRHKLDISYLPVCIDAALFGTATLEYTYWYRLKEKVETAYSSGSPLSITTTYTYNSSNLQSSIAITSSTGKTQKKEIRYPQDVNNYMGPNSRNSVTTAIISMGSPVKHMLSYPIETITYEDNKVIAAEVQTYNWVNHEGVTLIKPYQAFRLESTQPLTDYFKSGFIASGSTESNPDAPLLTDRRLNQQMEAKAYDSKGNLLQLQEAAKGTTSYIWSYNQSLPVARVLNGQNAYASGATTAGYSGFEANPADLVNNNGWWGGSHFGAEAKTGKFSMKVDAASNGGFGPTRDFVLDEANKRGKFMLSCWIKVPESTNPVVATGWLVLHAKADSDTDHSPIGTKADPYFSLPARGGWQYFEAVLDLDRLTLPAGNIRLRAFLQVQGGSVLVDDIRLHRQDAQMTTYTYDPLVGMTSSSDERNNTTYYLYDSFGRLEAVKDEEGNILKSYKYHYVQTGR